MSAESQFQHRLQSIESLLKNIESTADPSLRSDVQELVSVVMELHAGAIERLLQVIRGSCEDGGHVVQKLGKDELVASLLVLYGLHPSSMEERVAEALDTVASRLHAREGRVELLSVQSGEVRLRLEANGNGCGSTAQALQQMVEDAVYQAAPDIVGLVIETSGRATNGQQGFVPLHMLQGSASSQIPLGEGVRQ